MGYPIENLCPACDRLKTSTSPLLAKTQRPKLEFSVVRLPGVSPWLLRNLFYCCIHDSAGMPPNFCRINDKRCSTLVGCAAFGGPARLGTRSRWHWFA